MNWYTCNSCGHKFNSGFFRIPYCPKCWSKSKQIGKVLKKLILIAILAVISLMILKWTAPGIRSRVITTAFSMLDTTMLFGYSKDAYLESIISGRLDEKYYTIKSERNYYSSILPHANVETTKPAGILPANTSVELLSIIRKGEHVWVPSSFYTGEKLQHVFVLFPRDWEKTVSVFNWNERVAAIRAQYEKTIRNNFELKEVKPEEEKIFQERYNDYFKVSEIMKGKNYYYAPKTVKPNIDKVYSYYLNPKNINMVILQTDKKWVRPELVISKAEETK